MNGEIDYLIKVFFIFNDMKIKCFFLFTIISFASKSQIKYDSISKINNSIIEINYDEGIKELIEKFQKINMLNNGIKGYTVQIYLGDNRADAQSIKYNFMKTFPNIKSVQYERVTPNWKVKVGRFRTKIEAEKLKNKIKNKFPNCFISEIIVPLGEFD